MDAVSEFEEEYEVDDELYDFAMSFCKQTAEASGVIDLDAKEEYVQLSLMDLFPGVFTVNG